MINTLVTKELERRNGDRILLGREFEHHVWVMDGCGVIGALLTPTSTWVAHLGKTLRWTMFGTPRPVRGV